MARKSQTEKAESRARILSAAARLIREKGIEQTSVAQVMDLAGMTHGGFYRHFDSKNHLITEAIGEAFHAGLDVFDETQAGNRDQAKAYVDQYISDQHIRTPEIGCPLPVLSSEVARGTDEWQEALCRGLDRATTKLAEGVEGAKQSDTLVILGLLVGTLSLARGIGEGPLREQLVEASEKHIRTMMNLD